MLVISSYLLPFTYKSNVDYLQVFSSHSLPVLLESADEMLSAGRPALPAETSHSPTAAGYDDIHSLWLALYNVNQQISQDTATARN